MLALWQANEQTFTWLKKSPVFGIQQSGSPSAVRSAVPEHPILEQNMKWIGSPFAEIWPFAYLGGIWNPIFGEKGRSYGVSEGAIRKSDAYRLSIVTIRPQFAIECLRRLNQQGVGHFGPKFGSVPLGVDP